MFNPAKYGPMGLFALHWKYRATVKVTLYLRAKYLNIGTCKKNGRKPLYIFNLGDEPGRAVILTLRPIYIRSKSHDCYYIGSMGWRPDWVRKVILERAAK
jgi:hypothetical protein